jgi:hypothetical protein
MRGSHANRPSRMVMARSRGAITGPLLMLLGAWGALIPFFGHSFSYGFTPDNTWTWTAARGWLEVLPGVAAFVGGLMLTTSAHRLSAMVGGWIAAAAGAWFVLGTVISPWWRAGNIGVPVGTSNHAVWERLGMFAGLGVVIVLLAGIALGRISVVGVRDMAASARRDAQARRVIDVRLPNDETTDSPAPTVTRLDRAETTTAGEDEPADTQPVTVGNRSDVSEADQPR